MSCQHNLLHLFLCGFAALTVSAQTCGEHVLEGTSCSINGKTTNNEKPADIRWAFTSSDGNTVEWKKLSSRKPPAGLTIEEDGSLRFDSVHHSNTGTYKYRAFDGSGTQIGDETMELKVYVSARTCGEHVLEGTSCSIKGKTTENEKAAEIRWGFTSSDGNTTEWKKGSMKKPPAGLTIEEDGSLRFESVDQSNTGTYKYRAFDINGQQIGDETVELTVYVKVPKPTVKSECKPDGTVTLLCDTGNYKDLNISWYEDDKIMQDETETHLTLTSSKIKENKLYACSVSNPTSREQSDRITVPYSGPDEVSAQTCGEHVLEGTSCSINGKTTNNEKPADIRWAFTSSDGTTAEWKKGSKKKPPAGLTIEEDGSLRFKSVDQSNTGTYKYTAFDANGQQIGAETVELKVYVKVPKPTVKSECKPDGTVTLLCDTGNYKDLNISWYEDDKIMQDEKTTRLTLTSSKVNENTQYACSVSNPVSSEQSDRITGSCSGPDPANAPKPTVMLNSTTKGTVKLICDAGNSKDQTISCYEDHSIMKDETKTNLTLKPSKVESKRYSCSKQSGSKLLCSSSDLCVNYYAVLGILAGGGALLFLLICFFIWCVCQSCRKKNRLL